MRQLVLALASAFALVACSQAAPPAAQQPSPSQPTPTKPTPVAELSDLYTGTWDWRITNPDNQFDFAEGYIELAGFTATSATATASGPRYNCKPIDGSVGGKICSTTTGPVSVIYTSVPETLKVEFLSTSGGLVFQGTDADAKLAISDAGRRIEGTGSLYEPFTGAILMNFRLVKR